MVNVYIFNDNNQTTPVIYLTFKDDVRFATFKTPRVVQTNYGSQASSGTDLGRPSSSSIETDNQNRHRQNSSLRKIII